MKDKSLTIRATTISGFSMRDGGLPAPAPMPT